VSKRFKKLAALVGVPVICLHDGRPAPWRLARLPEGTHPSMDSRREDGVS
jgi:hypothetical protein